LKLPFATQYNVSHDVVGTVILDLIGPQYGA